MGLELIACESPEKALSARYDLARRFARNPKRGDKWWFLLSRNDEPLFNTIIDGGNSAFDESIRLSISDITDGVETADIFHLNMFGLHLMTPLDDVVEPDPAFGADDSEWQLHQVSV